MILFAHCPPTLFLTSLSFYLFPGPLLHLSHTTYSSFYTSLNLHFCSYMHNFKKKESRKKLERMNRTSVLATRLYRSCLCLAALLSMGSKRPWREGWSGTLGAREEKAGGPPAATTRSASVRILTTKLPASVLKLRSGSTGGSEVGSVEEKSARPHVLERSLPDLGLRPMVWTAEPSS